MNDREKDELEKVSALLYIANLSVVCAGIVLILKEMLILGIIFGIISGFFYKWYEIKKFKIYEGEYK